MQNGPISGPFMQLTKVIKWIESLVFETQVQLQSIEVTWVTRRDSDVVQEIGELGIQGFGQAPCTGKNRTLCVGAAAAKIPVGEQAEYRVFFEPFIGVSDLPGIFS